MIIFGWWQSSFLASFNHFFLISVSLWLSSSSSPSHSFFVFTMHLFVYMCSCRLCAAVLCVCFKKIYINAIVSRFCFPCPQLQVFEIHHIISGYVQGTATTLYTAALQRWTTRLPSFLPTPSKAAASILIPAPTWTFMRSFRKWTRGWNLGSNETERQEAVGGEASIRSE